MKSILGAPGFWEPKARPLPNGKSALDSNVTSFVIIKMFISNCNLTTQFISVTVTDYTYIYFVIK